MDKPKHFRKIDFLRGIAILAVFQAHFIWYYFPDYAGLAAVDSHHSAARVVLLNFLPRTIGWGGVTIFILVSGFLLHLGYLKDPQFTLRGFYSRRFWRVYPPYLLVLTVFSLFLEKGLFSTREGWWTFLLHGLSLHNLFARTYFSVNPTFWCLALEIQLYVLYAPLLYGRKRWGMGWMVVLAFCISVAWQAIGMRVGRLANSLPWANSAIALWVVWAAGAFLAETYNKGRRLSAALSRRQWVFAVVLLVLVGFVVPLNALLQYVAGVIGVFLMDWFLHAGTITLQSRPARLVVTIGLCSFSVFLIHQPLLQAMIDFLNLHSPHYPGYRYINGIPVAVIIFGISYAMYHFVELPSIRLGSRVRALFA